MTVRFNRPAQAIEDAILDRAAKMAAEAGYPMDNEDRTSLLMDLAAANGVNGNDPLDFERLLAADDFNFSHDVWGIRAHMDRMTGRLMGHFSPRFSRPRHAARHIEAAETERRSKTKGASRRAAELEARAYRCQSIAEELEGAAETAQEEEATRQRLAHRTELTPEGEQYVIPGAERRTTPKARQLDLWG